MRNAWTPWRLCSAAAASVMTLVITTWAAPEETETSTAARSQYVDRLTREFQIETVEGTPQRLVRTEKSLLRWSWPRNGFTDGQTYAWGTTGRPLAIGGAFLIPSEQVAYYEFVSLAPQPLTCKQADRIVWTPPAAELSWRVLSDAPEVAPTSAARLIQLRSLSQQMRGVAHLGPPRYEEGARWELRLLTTPIHRYADAERGILEGAVFVMVMGTDPQLLLLLEAQQEAGQAEWKAAFARLSGFELAAMYGEKEVWQSPKVENGHAKDSVWHLSKPLDAAELFSADVE
jgi:hypothetical protein